MADHKFESQPGDDLDRDIHNQRISEPHDHLAVLFGNMLDRSDTFIYAVVGGCFLIGAVLALGITLKLLGKLVEGDSSGI